MNAPEHTTKQHRADEPPPLTEREATDLEDAMFEAEERAYGLHPDDDAPGVSEDAVAQILAEGRGADARVDQPTDQAIADAARAVSELRARRETFDNWAAEARRHHERSQRAEAELSSERHAPCREL